MSLVVIFLVLVAAESVAQREQERAVLYNYQFRVSFVSRILDKECGEMREYRVKRASGELSIRLLTEMALYEHLLYLLAQCRQQKKRSLPLTGPDKMPVIDTTTSQPKRELPTTQETSTSQLPSQGMIEISKTTPASERVQNTMTTQQTTGLRTISPDVTELQNTSAKTKQDIQQQKVEVVDDTTPVMEQTTTPKMEKTTTLEMEKTAELEGDTTCDPEQITDGEERRTADSEFMQTDTRTSAGPETLTILDVTTPLPEDENITWIGDLPIEISYPDKEQKTWDEELMKRLMKKYLRSPSECGSAVTLRERWRQYGDASGGTVDSIWQLQPEWFKFKGDDAFRLLNHCPVRPCGGFILSVWSDGEYPSLVGQRRTIPLYAGIQGACKLLQAEVTVLKCNDEFIYSIDWKKAEPGLQWAGLCAMKEE